MNARSGNGKNNTASMRKSRNFRQSHGDFRGVLRERQLHNKPQAVLAAIMDSIEPPITSEQAHQIRALLREIGASEASLLKELNVRSVESMHDVVFKRALSVLEVWRREKQARSA
jgi:hypothetical protein